MLRLKYYINNPVNNGTAESPEWVDIPITKSIPYSEANEEIAKREAYNGEYTIEDDGQPEPEVQQTPEERIAELEEALDMLLNGVTE